MNELEREYQNIRKLFFPRWDREDLWKVSSKLPEDRKSCVGLMGYCNTDNKIIHVMTDSEGYSLTLVHEICHAVTTQSHDKKWCRRMMKATAVANQLGNHQLAVMIKEEVDGYAKGLRFGGAAEVESRFHDAVFDAPSLDFESIVRGVASELALSSEQLLKKWPAASKRGFESGKLWSAQIRGLKKTKK